MTLKLANQRDDIPSDNNANISKLIDSYEFCDFDQGAPEGEVDAWDFEGDCDYDDWVNEEVTVCDGNFKEGFVVLVDPSCKENESEDDDQDLSWKVMDLN